MNDYERYDEENAVERRCCENLRTEFEREIAKLQAQLTAVSEQADELLEKMQDERDEARRDRDIYKIALIQARSTLLLCTEQLAALIGRVEGGRK